MVGMMVDEERPDFSTQLHEIFPKYQRGDAQANITIADLLSHRTGIAPYDGLWLSSDNQIVMERSQAIPTFNYAPVVSPLRAKFGYNHIAYEIVGQVLEKTSGSTYLDLLRERIINPLRLNRTFYADQPFDDNTAKAYAALSNGSTYELPPWGYGKDILIGSRGALRSSISGMMVLYKAVMDAANSGVEVGGSGAHNPFKLMPQLFEGKIGLLNQSWREYTYALGMRAQLPNIVDLFLDYSPPELGRGSPWQLSSWYITKAT
ncbi:beta-lactamase/transpeptidase-like protein [Leptodontidium sp. 2 PMI_412]|nr:beta-lactamase/transpeptidase-like protein [Leptodontidium sp. 2 PMI_412]